MGKERELLEILEKNMRICNEGTSQAGVNKTRHRFAIHYFWPGCYKKSGKFVRSRDFCQRADKNADKKTAPMSLVPQIREIFSIININACVPFLRKKSGNRYLITAICMVSYATHDVSWTFEIVRRTSQ